MNQIFLKATEVGAGKEKLFELLKDTVAQNAIEMDDRILNDVYLVACKAYEGKRRYSGEEYVTHPLNVAILLAELGADRDTVLAGLFCDVKTKGNNINFEKELPVFCKPFLYKIAKCFCRLLHLHFVGVCKASTDSYSASRKTLQTLFNCYSTRYGNGSSEFSSSCACSLK